MSSILIVGSVAFDTLHLPTGSHPRVLGGSAVYAALSASRFAPCAIVGVAGRDFPSEEIAHLVERGIDVTGIEIADGETFHWEGRYTDDLLHRTTLRTDLNVLATFAPKIPAHLRSPKLIMLGNIAPELQLSVLDQTSGPRYVVADTMNFWIDSARADLGKVLERIDLLVINEEEAWQLSGERHVGRVARALLALGPKGVVVKRGEYGAMLFHDDKIFSAPGYPLDVVVDPTGAGDSFAGGLIGYLARAGRTDHDSLRAAVIHGSAVASFSVQGVSTDRLRSLSDGELTDRIHSFDELVRFPRP